MSEELVFRGKVGELGGHQIDLRVKSIEVARVSNGDIVLYVRHDLIGTWPNWIVQYKNDETYNAIQSPVEPYLPALVQVVEKFVKENKDSLLSNSVAKAAIDVDNLDFSQAYTAGTRGWNCRITIPVKKVKN